MTGLLTAAAVITTIMLLASATNAAARATASDQHKRGPWGIATYSSSRNRPLNPHQRRWQTMLLSAQQQWQTTLLSGRDIDPRWGDLVNEIQALQDLANTTGVGPAPKNHDNKWIEASIANLEQSISIPTPASSTPAITIPPGDTTT